MGRMVYSPFFRVSLGGLPLLRHKHTHTQVMFSNDLGICSTDTNRIRSKQVGGLAFSDMND